MLNPNLSKIYCHTKDLCEVISKYILNEGARAMAKLFYKKGGKETVTLTVRVGRKSLRN